MKHSIFAALSVGGLFLAAQPVFATAPVGDPLGGVEAMRELNAIVFGDTSGWLAVQGKTFVGGNVKGGGEFGIGNAGKSEVTSGRSTLTVGGSIQAYSRLQNGANGALGQVGAPASVTVGNALQQIDLATNNASVKVGGTVANVNGSAGSAVQSGSVGQGYLNANGGTIATNLGAGFTTGLQDGINAEGAKLKADLTALSVSLAGLDQTAGNSVSNNYGAWTFNAVNDGSGKSVFNLTDAAFNGWQWTLNLADPTTTVVFNVSGNGTYNWNSTLSGAFQGVADHVVWNFANASTVNISQTVYGSVLAPLAQLQANSAINGTLVANRLQASSGVNLGTYAGTDFGFAGSVPEPATWGMMIIGFGLVGAAMRRRNRGIAHANA